ncbi:SLC13 family permease [Agromyces sp. NPDC058126]|uniref:SLC13 family permease n=1 Tax=Agromyces sp. NPDC058126 TaxID=3346350 RepID=UPI0036DB1928
MRIAVVGSVLVALGIIAVAGGVLPIEAVGALAARSAPILGFVVAMTIVAELAAEAGVFRSIAQQLARFARGRAMALWLLVVALATASTVFLSLDTTAVLLTPVVVSVAAHARISPIPFALTTVWLANTASLLLPVSNLTNLLAAGRLGAHPVEFAAVMWAPAVLVLLVPLLVSGIDVWIPATAGAAVLFVAFLLRRPSVLRPALVPWQLVVFVAGLFVVMEAAHELRLTEVLASIAGEGEDPLELLRLAGVAAVSANAFDNLPAYLALEPFASSPLRTAALLIGVNAGALVTPWASLATLLWHHRLVSMGVQISWPKFAALGLAVAPLTVTGAVFALAAFG